MAPAIAGDGTHRPYFLKIPTRMYSPVWLHFGVLGDAIQSSNPSYN